MEKKLDNLVNPLVRQLKKNEATLHKIIDRLSFPQIFIIYIIFIIIGGFAFYYNPFPGAALKAPAGNVDLTIGDAVYFSFIAATSTGFGDIVPVGANRFIAIFEVTFALFLFAIITSKLIGYKQDLILGELIQITSNERIQRLRSALLLFRTNLVSTLASVDDGSIKKREVQEIWHYFNQLESAQSEIKEVIAQFKKSELVVSSDPVQFQVLISSVRQSFDRILELINHLEAQNHKWKTDQNRIALENCYLHAKSILENYLSLEHIEAKVAADLEKVLKDVENVIKPDKTE
ncbi:two pore domain potassium channel family protein [Candidatus Woesearchaeota archaeon]|nr:two pore domain potassium channel family protein [Candidatus Woesearchaeota archaeon]HIH38314.1 two pore domain potassium channel family protein [Candidatus Woesearchaeota archaeon]HIJ03294.1 two pore domain potassium channel family protein [Candidatus Woesearchaeota archaeon]